MQSAQIVLYYLLIGRNMRNTSEAIKRVLVRRYVNQDQRKDLHWENLDLNA